jgi:hypothetical protein
VGLVADAQEGPEDSRWGSSQRSRSLPRSSRDEPAELERRWAAVGGGGWAAPDPPACPRRDGVTHNRLPFGEGGPAWPRIMVRA